MADNEEKKNGAEAAAPSEKQNGNARPHFQKNMKKPPFHNNRGGNGQRNDASRGHGEGHTAVSADAVTVAEPKAETTVFFSNVKLPEVNLHAPVEIKTEPQTAQNGLRNANGKQGQNQNNKENKNARQNQNRPHRENPRFAQRREPKKENPDTPTETEAIGEETKKISAPETEAVAVSSGIAAETGKSGNGSAPVTESTEPKTDSKTPIEIVGVRFKPAGKVYYFSPDGNSYKEKDTVIVETARGMEFGFVVTPNRTVLAGDIVSPLKKVLRHASEEDIAHYEENNRRREETIEICRKKIVEHHIDMKIVDVEFTFDNSKLLFYFTADGRVDFRELVKDLASVFHTRIELRQIGIRDESKLMGGLGVCGRPLCCHSFLSDFVQVSIKMAKEQNLSLNSAKISGTCGRLMCCLRYEYDVYDEEIRKTPKVDTVVETPDGDGVVTEVIPLAGMIRVKFLGRDTPPRLYHRDNVKVKGKMNWKNGTVVPVSQTAETDENSEEEPTNNAETT